MIELLTLLILSGSVRAATPYSPLIGFESINLKIRTQVMRKQSTFTLAKYLGSSDLTDILKPRYGDGLTDEDRNGKPNRTNILLWYLVAKGFAQDLAQVCVGNETSDTAAQLSSDFKFKLQTACVNPDDDRALKDLWIGTMGFTAPQAEFESWRVYAKQSLSTSKEAWMRDLLIALFFNPYFMIKI